MRRLAIMVLLIVGTMAPGRGTVAFFTSATASAANTFSAGSIELADIPATALVTFSNMYPGAAVYGSVTVRNSGTVSLRYSVATTSADDGTTPLGDLASALQVEIRHSAPTCNAAGFSSGTLAQAGESAFGNTTGALKYVMGDAADSANAFNRELAPGATDATLCLRVRLPENAVTALQGQSTNVKIKFVGVQKSGL